MSNLPFPDFTAEDSSNEDSTSKDSTDEDSTNEDSSDEDSAVPFLAPYQTTNLPSTPDYPPRRCKIPFVRITSALALLLLCAPCSIAQQSTLPTEQQPAPPASSRTQAPQVKVNFLNVCTPSDTERQQIASALSRIPTRPHFAPDFEVSRGVSSLSDNLLAAGEGAQMKNQAPPLSRWVRVRKEFPDQAPFINAQYSFSITDDHVVETLVFRSRDARDLMQVSLSDSVTSSQPFTLAKSDTSADRIRIERFGKSSLVVARCPDADQSKFEPLFQQATSLLAAYRKALNVRTIVTTDLAKIPIPK